MALDLMRSLLWRLQRGSRGGGGLVRVMLALVVFSVSSSTAVGQAILDPEDRELLQSIDAHLLRGPLPPSLQRDLRELVAEVPDAWEALAVVYRWRRHQGTWDPRGADNTNPLTADLDYLAGRIAELAGTEHDGLLLVAENHELRGRYEEALRTFDQVLSLCAGDPEALLGRLRVLLTLGQRKTVREELKEASSVIRQRGMAAADTNWYLGCLYHLVGRYEEGALELASRHMAQAERAWRNAGDPRRSQALVELARIHLDGRKGFAGIEGDALEAIRGFKDALEQDPYVPRAHVGLARTYLFRDEIGNAEEQIDEELAKRPDEPEAIALKAGFFLRDNRYSDARELLDRALRVNPRHREVLAFLAACQYLSGEPGYEATVSTVLEIDPIYGHLFAVIGDAVALHYRFAEAIPFYRRALETDPLEHPARIGLGQCLAHTGRLEDALEELRRAQRLDGFPYMWRGNMIGLLEGYSRMPPITREPFRYRIHGSDEPVLLDYLHAELTASYRDLAQAYGQKISETVQIEVLHRHKDFSVRTIGFAGFGALGVCFGNVMALVSPASELRGSFVWAQTARHELAHVFSLAASRLRVPRWLTEGLSVYEEQRARTTWDREMDLELITAYHNDRLIPLGEMNAAFRTPRILFAYYQGGLICQFVAERYGFETLVRMLQLYGEDRETAEVFRTTLSMSLGEFDELFRNWVFETRIREVRLYPLYDERKKDELRLLVRAHPDSVELREQLAWAYFGLQRFVDMDVHLARALELDAARPGLDFLRGNRALSQGNKDEALRFFEAGVERGGDDLFVRLHMASLYEERGELVKVREALEKAKACFPRFVGPGNAYARLARWLEQQGDADAAAREYIALTRIDQTALAPRFWLVGYFEQKRDYEAMLGYLREVIEVDPFQRRPHVALGRAYRALGRHADALREFRVALAVDPSMEPDYNPPPTGSEPADQATVERRVKASIHVEIARTQEELGQLEEARRAVEQALELDPESTEARELREALQRSTP
ncbi:MAG: tetratricopeptide repeat protein [Planctomycetota bacterium]